jgi:hypothetical protein
MQGGKRRSGTQDETYVRRWIDLAFLASQFVRLEKREWGGGRAVNCEEEEGGGGKGKRLDLGGERWW